MAVPQEDYLKFAEGLDDMRESLHAVVAGFVADGFTDEQARAIVAGIFANAYNKMGKTDG